MRCVPPSTSTAARECPPPGTFGIWSYSLAAREGRSAAGRRAEASQRHSRGGVVGNHPRRPRTDRCDPHHPTGAGVRRSMGCRRLVGMGLPRRNRTRWRMARGARGLYSLPHPNGADPVVCCDRHRPSVGHRRCVRMGRARPQCPRPIRARLHHFHLPTRATRPHEPAHLQRSLQQHPLPPRSPSEQRSSDWARLCCSNDTKTDSPARPPCMRGSWTPSRPEPTRDAPIVAPRSRSLSDVRRVR